MSSCISPLSRAPTTTNTHHHTHQRLSSEPHSYNIQAKLRNGILSIFVHDTMTNCQWRQEFTQISFPSHKLYHVAKALIMAIQTMINSAKSNQVDDPKPIAILVYNQWCYLTIQNSQFPSFALRPINQQQPKPLPSLPPRNEPKGNCKPAKYTKANLSRLPFPTRPLPPLPKPTPVSHKQTRSLPQSHSSQSFNSHNYAHSMYQIPNAQSSKSSKPHIIIEDDEDAFNSSSECSDYEDAYVEDEDSDSFKYQRTTSMDSIDNTGSLDSLFTNSGSGNDSIYSPHATKKMKIFNVSECMDDDDLSDEESTGTYSPMNQQGNMSPFRANTRWMNGNQGRMSSPYGNGGKRKMRGRKRKKIEKSLVICLNGSVIDDLESHAMEQVIAEEEYYDEEEDQTPDYYDPNYLGVQPYYDD